MHGFQLHPLWWYPIVRVASLILSRVFGINEVVPAYRRK